MNNVLGSSSKVKVIVTIVLIGLILITWYKLRVQGLAMTVAPEAEYQIVLTCGNTEKNHVYTDKCYDLAESGSLEENTNTEINEKSEISVKPIFMEDGQEKNIETEDTYYSKIEKDGEEKSIETEDANYSKTEKDGEEKNIETEDANYSKTEKNDDEKNIETEDANYSKTEKDGEEENIETEAVQYAKTEKDDKKKYIETEIAQYSKIEKNDEEKYTEIEENRQPKMEEDDVEGITIVDLDEANQLKGIKRSSEPKSDKTQQIIFWHRQQDNDDFASKSPPNDYYRPYAEYGYSGNELTNIVQFVVVLADKNGKVILNGSNPNVNLPEGSIVPDEYIFDVGINGTVSITESTFAGISIPGYSYAGSYAYFGWTGNYDMQTMINVETFKNFGAKSTKYKNYGESFYSVIGYSGYGYLANGAEREKPGYSDYSYKEFGTEGYNYWAYQSTGVLMIVLRPVSDDVSYRTYYHNDYNPGGIANLNIIDTTVAHMVRDDWDAVNYRYNYHGEVIMTNVTDLIPPSEDYIFDGWYDNVDPEGNGTGNKIIGSSQDENGTVYYFAVTESDNQKIEILANNNIYARWIQQTNAEHILLPETGGRGVYMNNIIGIGMTIMSMVLIYYHDIIKKRKIIEY